MKEKMDISIVIVSYNTKRILKNCLESIYVLLESGSNEIIVIDNNSKDGTTGLIERKFDKVKLIKNYKNLGFGKANNQGMKQAKGEFILLLNSDTVASKGVIYKCLDYLKSSSDVGVLGCCLKNLNGSLENSCGKFYSMWNVVFGGMVFSKKLKKLEFIKFRIPEYLLSAKDIEKTMDVDWVSGAFMFLRKTVFEQSGGFDENIFLYGEEMEWCYRIKKNGWHIVYYPEVEIVHIGKASGSFLGEFNRNKRMILGKEYFFRKHSGSFKVFSYRMLIFLSAMIKMPVLFILYLFSGFKPALKSRIIFCVSCILYSVRRS